jgi:hypothetical protein
MDTSNPFILIGVALLALLVQYFIIKGAVAAAIKEVLNSRHLKGGGGQPDVINPGNY